MRGCCAGSHAFFFERPPLETRPRAREDERGAVMLIGVFMACFLIGAVWSVVGLGDLLVYRDKVQEIADHAAFSSATVHARGMNFICAMNLIMLAIVACYLVIDLVDKVLGTISTFSAGACLVPFTAPVACPLNSASTPLYRVADRWRNVYLNEMKPVLLALSKAQTVVAMTAPYGGAAAGAQVASDYGEIGMTVSSSMLPGFGLTGGLMPSSSTTKLSFKGADPRLGLPVTSDPMNKLCTYVAAGATQWIEDWMKKLPFLGWILSLSGLEGSLKNTISAAVTGGSCNELTDPFWKQDGPKSAYESNGSDWHQVWGFVFPSYDDASESKIALAKGPKDGVNTPTTFGNTLDSFYVAQAEFYFDCDGAWDSDACNGADIPNSMFSMRWMARLRRIRYPNIAGGVVSWLTNTLTSSGVLEPIKGAIAKSDWYKKLGQKLHGLADKYGGSAGGWLVGGLFGDLAKPEDGAILRSGANVLLNKAIDNLKNLVPQITSPPATGMLH